jgi:hypothetical protein
MLRLKKVSHGYEDQNGFHYVSASEAVIVPVDEVRPSWANDKVFDRLLDQGVSLRSH